MYVDLTNCKEFFLTEAKKVTLNSLIPIYRRLQTRGHRGHRGSEDVRGGGQGRGWSYWLVSLMLSLFPEAHGQENNSWGCRGQSWTPQRPWRGQGERPLGWISDRRRGHERREELLICVLPARVLLISIDQILLGHLFGDTSFILPSRVYIRSKLLFTLFQK